MTTSFIRSLGLVFSLYFAGCFTVFSQTRSAPDFGDSITWSDKGESPSFSNLEGKSVLVVFFQSWCGICNGWSGDLFKELEEVYRDDSSVVVVALKTDGGTVADAEKYLSSRVDFSDWLVGVDEGGSYYQALAETDALYHYTWVQPDGSIGETAKAGTFFEEKGGGRRYTLVDSKTVARFRKGASPLFPQAGSWGEEVAPAIDAAEKGRFVTALKLASKVRTDGASQLKGAIAEKVDKTITAFTSKVNDPNEEARYSVFLKLSNLSDSFGSSPQGKAAREVVNAQQRQPWIRDEKEAHKSYQSIMKRAARADSEKDRERIQKSLKKLAEKFPATYYGRLAGSN